MVADPRCYGLSGIGRTVLRIHWARIERGLPRFASASYAPGVGLLPRAASGSGPRPCCGGNLRRHERRV